MLLTASAEAASARRWDLVGTLGKKINKNEKIKDQTKKVGHSWQAAAHASEGRQGVVPGDQGVQDQALEQVELFAGVERQVHRGGDAQLQDGCDRKRGTSSDLPK